MNLLFLDIESSPNIADVWQLWNVGNISLSQLREASRLMCFAAKWHHEDEVMWWCELDAEMLTAAWHLLDEADVVCDYNGKRFDIPTLNKEFLLAGLGPPAPFQHLDLLQVIRRQFRFPSNKLEYVADVLELSGKMKNSGHQLWTRCMLGDEEAWKEMKQYNMQDVTVLEEVYEDILPWIPNHPNLRLYGEAGCIRCGIPKLTKQGFAYTSTGKYQRWKCINCGGWSQDTKRVSSAELRST